MSFIAVLPSRKTKFESKYYKRPTFDVPIANYPTIIGRIRLIPLLICHYL